MTTETQARQQPPIADLPMTGDEIAPDLASLMERMERVRKFLVVEREYIKLVLIGGWFILVGAIVTPGFPWRALLVLTLAATPWLFGWYNLPRLRLANAFRNETMPFLLRDYGRWNYALTGTHFSRDLLRRSGLINPGDALGVSSIMTGERFGVPLQMAVVSAWPQPRFVIYRGSKANFTGWAASLRLPHLPEARCLILPLGEKPRDPASKAWTASPLSPTHQMFMPPGHAPISLDPALLARLLQSMLAEPKTAYAISEGVLWMLVPGSDVRFNEATALTVELNEPAPYERARTQLADMFKVIDRLVWPSA